MYNLILRGIECLDVPGVQKLDVTWPTETEDSVVDAERMGSGYMDAGKRNLSWA